MPIFIKDYKWSDSPKQVVITIPLRGIAASKTDVVLTSEYLKVSFSPYIFECFFYQPVSEDGSEFVASDGIMQVTVNKAEQQQQPTAWPQLMIDAADDKSATKEIRQRALARYSELLQAASSAARASHRANEQLSLREQMKLEEADLARVEAAKQAERDSAMRELEAFRMRQQRLRDEARRLFREEDQQQQEEEEVELQNRQSERGEDSENEANVAEQEEEKEGGATQIFEQQQPPAARAREPIESVLGVRQAGRIGVSFTARVFPTPERESQKSLEEEWLRKQAERRRMADVDAAAASVGEGDAATAQELSERERDPVWLRDKGNRLFAAANFQAAANAYSHAIALKSEMHSLFSNRAACQLKLGNYFKALEDASKALELLQPPVEQNRRARVRAHCRRAAALSGLAAHAEAAVELAEAARLAPDSDEIRADLERVRAAAAGAAAAGDNNGDSGNRQARGLDDVDD